MLATPKKRASVIGLAAALSLTMLGSTATADPNLTNRNVPLPSAQGGFLPDGNDLIGVGSDTTQYVMNLAAQAYSFQGGAFVDRRLASYDACQPGSSPQVCNDPIVVEDPDQALVSGVPTANGDETTILRRNGSTTGISGLWFDPVVDFVRSSYFPSPTPGGPPVLYFIPVLTDGMSYIVDDTASPDIRNLDVLELRDIYLCTDSRGYHPKLPQVGSGTRAYFLQQIGVLESELGGCVDQPVQANDPSPVNGDPLALMPFSVARWTNHPPNPSNPPRNVVDIAASATTAGVFYAPWTMYNVVRKVDYDAAGSPLPPIFGPGGFMCTRFSSAVPRQGFRLAPNCGTLIFWP